MPIQGLQFTIPSGLERHQSYQATGSFIVYNPNDGVAFVATDRTATGIAWDYKVPSQSGGRFPGPINSYLSVYYLDQSGAGTTGQIIVYASPESVSIPHFWSIGRALTTQSSSMDIVTGSQPGNPGAGIARLWVDGNNNLHLLSGAGVDQQEIDTNDPAGGMLTGTYPNPSIANGVIGLNSPIIQDGAINAAKIQPKTITAGQIADGQITSALIADGTIQDVDVAVSALNVNKLNQSTAFGSGPLTNDYFRLNTSGTGMYSMPNNQGIIIGAAGCADYQTGRLFAKLPIDGGLNDASQISNGTILGTKLANGAITATQIAANAITQAYTQVAAPSGSTTSTVMVNCPAPFGTNTTFLVNSTADWVKFSGVCYCFHNTATAFVYLQIWLDGAAWLNVASRSMPQANTQFPIPFDFIYNGGLAAGTHNAFIAWKVDTGTASWATAQYSTFNIQVFRR